MIDLQPIDAFVGARHSSGQFLCARSLCKPSAAVEVSFTCDMAIRAFHDDPALNSIAVLDSDKRVIGVLRSLDLLRRGTEGYFHELVGRHSCTRFMDPSPLVFDVNDSLLHMSKAVSQIDDRHLVDGFFVTENGRYFGAGRMSDLIRAVTQQQLLAARYANPLTALPGNVPIDQHIQYQLTAQQRFVVAYFDLDNFKPFNDLYGYMAGDAVIALTAKAIGSEMDDRCDFLGHVGGDDFVAVIVSADWESRISRILVRFDEEVFSHFQPEHQKARGMVTRNRQGVEVFHGLVCLSVGVVRVAPGQFGSHSEISARLVEAKKQAKAVQGSSYFVDRRTFVHMDARGYE